MMQNAINFAEKHDPNTLAILGACNFSGGTAAEAQVKYFLMLFDAVLRGTAKEGEYDAIKYVYGTDGKKHRMHIEVKTNSGSMGKILENGTVVHPIYRSDFIVYCPIYKAGKTSIDDFVVFPRQEFLDLLIEHNMYRLNKMTGTMCKIKKAGMPWRYDMAGIQDFSYPARHEKWLNAIYFNGENIYDFCNRLGIKHI